MDNSQVFLEGPPYIEFTYCPSSAVYTLFCLCAIFCMKYVMAHILGFEKMLMVRGKSGTMGDWGQNFGI